MVTNKEKIAARTFYSDLFQQFTEMFSLLETLEFLESKTIGYLKLGDEQGYLHQGDNFDDYIELKRINPGAAPQTVIDSFERHVWYSQRNLSEIIVFKDEVEGQETFAIYICGYVDDGWDNGCFLLEVYNVEGEFLGAITDGINWEEQPLDHQNYYHITPVYGEPGDPLWFLENIQEV